jgi:predicted membrane protein
MGSIVYKTLIRTAIVIAAAWYFADNYYSRFLWILFAMIFFLFVLYPAYTEYKKFQETKVKTLEGTLCASCRHYDPTASLCMKYDKHPTPNDIPCNGNDWEPK